MTENKKTYLVYSNGEKLGKTDLNPEQVQKATKDGLTLIRA